VRALEEIALFGVETNRAFLIQALCKESFVSGEATTAFIAESFSNNDLAEKPMNSSLAALSALTHFLALRAGGEGEITAPLHGALTEVFVTAGDKVKIGTRIAVIEAMKMQHDILADMDGTVSEIFAEAGSQIAANALLFKLTS